MHRNPRHPDRYDQARRFLARWLARVRFDVDGLEHVPPAGPALLVMNHTGWEEILLTMLAIPRPLRIVGMYDLVHLDDARSRARIFDTAYARGFGPLPRTLLIRMGNRYGRRLRQLADDFGYIPARVFSPTWQPVLGKNGVRAIVEALDAGEIVMLFPEGGYRRDGVMTPFKPGIGLLIRLLQRRNLRVPIVPAAQHTAGCMTPLLTTRFVARLVIGAPVVPDAPPPEPVVFDRALARLLQDRIAALLGRARPGGPPQTYRETPDTALRC